MAAPRIHFTAGWGPKKGARKRYRLQVFLPIYFSGKEVSHEDTLVFETFRGTTHINRRQTTSQNTCTTTFEDINEIGTQNQGNSRKHHTHGVQ